MKEVKFIYKYLKKELPFLILAILLATCLAISLTLIPYYIGKAIDSIDLFSLENSNFDWSNFYLNICLALAFLAVLVVFQYIFSSILGVSIERITKNLRNDIFKKLNNVSISYIDKNKKGDLISRTINDVDNINTALVSSFSQFYLGIFQILVTLVFMLTINWIMGLIVIVLTPFSFLLSYFVAKKSRKYYKKSNYLLGQETATTLELLNNIETAKSYNYGDIMFEKFKKQNDDLYKVGQKSQFISSLTNPTSRLINNFTYIFVGVVGIVLLIYTSKNGMATVLGTTISVGIISTFLQYSNQFSKPFNEITSCFGEIQNGFASLIRIKALFDEPNDVDYGIKEISNNIETIRFENINFSYDNTRQIIKNFNLEVNGAKKIAIVGPTGCGKTTLINLLLRFYDPNEGKVEINNIDNLDIKKSKLRSKLGMVLQDTWIFNGTILENITYGKKDASKEEVIDACKRANCLDFIERLPNGFNTIINNDDSLSTGQKQLISIARVMLLNPDIMIFDEATSNIDTRTEMIISKALNELTKNKTSFVIAHRLNTIVNSDLILVMKDGEIIEKGTHKELIDNKGFYYSLFNAQFCD